MKLQGNEEIVSEKILYEMNSRERDSLVEIISNLNKYLESDAETNNLLYLNTVNQNTLPIYPVSYTQVLDYFRPDFDDAGFTHDNLSGNQIEEEVLDLDNSTRTYNPIKLRSTARNSIVTFNAIQKVFKSRFDEGRSNARLQDLSNSFTTEPFLTERRPGYEGLLSKNGENFFSVNFYNTKLNSNNSSLLAV